MCFRNVCYICVLSEKKSTENINLERMNAFTTKPDSLHKE